MDAKVSMVMGRMAHPQIVGIAEDLAGREGVEVNIYGFAHEAVKSFHFSNRMRIHLFEEDPVAPGYMKGIESCIDQSDLIIAYGTAHFSTFQSRKVATEFGLPFCVICPEIEPQPVWGLRNLHAIRQDVLQNADAFLVPNRLARAALFVDGVSADRIWQIPPYIDLTKFSKDMNRRLRFRQHIGLDSNHTVLLFNGPLEDDQPLEPVLRSLSLLRSSMKEELFRNIKVLLAGNGSAAQALKYLVHDLGLGENVLFLHQEISPFATDLYNACDYSLIGNMEPCDGGYPLAILEAVACGVVPIADASRNVSGVLEGVEYLPFPAMQRLPEVAATFGCLFEAENAHHAVAEGNLVRLQEGYGSEVQSRFSDFCLGLLRKSSDRDQGKKSFAEVRRICALALQQQKYQQALDQANTIISVPMPVEMRSDLMRIKGEAFYGLGNYPLAMDCYSQALKYNGQNDLAYCGLGYISLKNNSFREAFVFFKRAYSICSNNPKIMLGLGLVSREHGQYEEAIYWFEKALPYEEYCATSIVLFSQAVNECPDVELAVFATRRALDIHEGHHVLQAALGQLLFKSGKTEEGTKLLQAV